MELKDQVVSLTLARKLKELGVTQESYFWWIDSYNSQMSVHDRRVADSNISAFTVAELGELLPPETTYINTKNGWKNVFLKGEKDGVCAKTEADARAKMLIYLLENTLIPLEAVK